jgi:zinc/manganese transport system substrate-binding protein
MVRVVALSTSRWLLIAGVLLGGLASSAASGATSNGVIQAVGAENQYANVIAQVGGKYVHVEAVMSNPATDPHEFEASTSVAREIASARLIVQNGVGYDTFMHQLESASPNSSRKVVTVQTLLGLSSSTKNPHLWYEPTTMPRVAKAVANDLSAIDPTHATYFAQRLGAFDASMSTVTNDIRAFRAKFARDRVATTEPVADYLLTSLGLKNSTPFSFQADIMNGVDPSPEDVSFQQDLFTTHAVKVFCYNAQVSSPVTVSLRDLATKSHVPVVAVYETMPTPGYDYQTWMIAEIDALTKAIEHDHSTTSLVKK